MLKAAIIGCGMIANSAHIPAYKYFNEYYDLAGVCDKSIERAKDTAERHSLKLFYDDVEVMLRELKPDIVSVCVPNMYHKDYIKTALEAGANVICEKPLALTYKDAKELFELAESKNLILCAAQSMRFTPDRLACKSLCDSGFFGDIYYSEFSRIRHRGIPEWGAFHIKEQSGGGAFVDIGVHMLDALVWLMDNPKIVSVTGTTSANFGNMENRTASDLKASGALTGNTFSGRSFDKSEFDVEDFACGSILFEGGKRVNFKVAWAANLPDETNIVLSGEKAGIKLPDFSTFGNESSPGSEFLPDAFIDKRFENTTFPGHFRLFENIALHMLGKKELPVKPEETITVSALIDMFYMSAEKQREVYFDEIR